ncbi:MAG: protein kinase domain-containing protein, partial [Terriglobales bacterium]
MALTSGERLGPYEILGAVGAGGMGEVYRARDTRLQREVAVKLLPVGRLEDAGALRRFEQEARTLAALNHPNLLTVFDVGTTAAGALYLVTELLEGGTLRERLTAGKLPQRTAVDFGMQMARGLAAAHDKGIIHRDLKPENIFCTADGRVKILDFGLAKLTSEAGAEDKTLAETGTAAGVVLGTVGYMAPEQARGQAADARSDIFSLGCVLYEMLAGRRAFRGDSAADVISAILREDPPDLASGSTSGTGTGSGVGAVPVALERIVRHCLEKEPRQRFQSASDVAFSLADLSSAGSAASGAIAAVTAPRSGRRLFFAAAGALGLAAAVALTWWLKPGAGALPQFQRVTYQQGTIFNARFLPDGQGILGAAAWNNAAAGLFTGRLDASGLSPVAADADRVLAVKSGEAAVLQHVSTVGGWVEIGTLATMPLAGGSPRPLLDNIQYADYNPIHGDLAITRFHNDSNSFSLEYPIGHVLYQAPGWVSDPHFSRDGSRIAFIVHPNFGDDLGRLAMVDLAGHLSLLSPQYSSTQGLGWSPSDK